MLLNELHKKHPWRSINKFGPIAKKYGFSDEEAKEYIAKNVFHDKLKVKSRKYFLPIYGSRPGVYQFDTLIQSKGSNPKAFLIIININSRKAYGYPMSNKGTDEVYKALNTWIEHVEPKPSQMTSDQDSAYCNTKIINFMKEHNIDYRTTEDNNHNILGIINRFMKTLRDLNKERDFTEETMKRILKLYNSSEHSKTGIAPNYFSEDDENKYICKMRLLSDKVKEQEGFNLKPNEKVRVILDKEAIGKKRSNLSKDYYIVDSKEGNGYLIKSLDESVGYYPRHKLVISGTGKQAKTLDDGKRGIVSEINGYDEKKDKYSIIYTDGTKDTIKAKHMRETRPTHLGPLEVKYWRRQKYIPANIKSFKGL